MNVACFFPFDSGVCLMAGSPRWKVFGPNKKYTAACKEIEAAAALVAFYGEGATIRDGYNNRRIVWTEGVDGDAGESYDHVAMTVYDRVGR